MHPQYLKPLNQLYGILQLSPSYAMAPNTVHYGMCVNGVL